MSCKNFSFFKKKDSHFYGGKAKRLKPAWGSKSENIRKTGTVKNDRKKFNIYQDVYEVMTSEPGPATQSEILFCTT